MFLQVAVPAETAEGGEDVVEGERGERGETEDEHDEDILLDLDAGDGDEDAGGEVMADEKTQKKKYPDSDEDRQAAHEGTAEGIDARRLVPATRSTRTGTTRPTSVNGRSATTV